MSETINAIATVVLDENGDEIRNDQGETLIMYKGAKYEWVALPKSTSTDNTRRDGSQTKESVERAVWGRTETIKLIELYKRNEDRFIGVWDQRKVWLELAAYFPTKTATQMFHRFRYLMAKYEAVKDSMSVQDDSKQRSRFDYYDEFDKLFSEDPNVTPILSYGLPPLNATQLPMPDNFVDDLCRDEVQIEQQITMCDETPRNRKQKALRRKKTGGRIKKLDKKRNHDNNVEIRERTVSTLERIAASLETYVEKL